MSFNPVPMPCNAFNEQTPDYKTCELDPDKLPREPLLFISPLLKVHFQGVHKVWYKRRGRWSCSPWKDVQATPWHNQIPFKTNRTGVGVFFFFLQFYIRCLPTFTVKLAWGRSISATVKIGWRRKYIRYASVCVLSRFIIYFI